MKYIGISLVVFVHLGAGLFLITQPGCQTADETQVVESTPVGAQDTPPIPVASSAEPAPVPTEDLFAPVDPAFNSGAPQPVVMPATNSAVTTTQRSAPTRPSPPLPQEGQVIGVLDYAPPPVNVVSKSPSEDGLPVVSSGPSLIAYEVVSGDSLWKIAKRFDVSIAAIKQASGLNSDTLRVGQVLQVPAADATVSVPAPPSELVSETVQLTGTSGREYIVVSGDTLSRISVRQGVSVRDIKSANNLNSDVIRVGQILMLPETSSAALPRPAPAAVSGIYHEVKAGENPTIIARRYGISVRQLLSWNNNFDPRLLKVGQRLRVGELGASGAQDVSVEPEDQTNYRSVEPSQQSVEVAVPSPTTPATPPTRIAPQPAQTEQDLEALLEDLEQAPVVSPVPVTE